MTGESAAVAVAVEEATAELAARAFACDDARWSAVVPEEEWPVGVLVHHVAEGHEQVMRWMQTALDGEAITDTAAGVDEANARHRSAAAGFAVPETVALLTANGARVAASLRSLDQGQLGQRAPFGPAGGAPLPVAALATAVGQHVKTHMEHARAALGDPDIPD